MIPSIPARSASDGEVALNAGRGVIDGSRRPDACLSVRLAGGDYITDGGAGEKTVSDDTKEDTISGEEDRDAPPGDQGDAHPDFGADDVFVFVPVAGPGSASGGRAVRQ